MCTTFYKSIIEDEIEAFGIKEESLKVAAKSVSNAYSKTSLTRGQTFLDYNNPPNRCAYIYKYASVHTGLVTKYFKQLISTKKVKSLLEKKETLKICCLGGGPGNDIVGLFKALASSPKYYQKIVEVTVLDICGGWRNSFKRVIGNLINGKVKDVPETFVNVENFKFKLIEVDLLQNLPPNIVTILSEADIVCMVKFVSAILGSSTSVSALQVMGSKLKVGSVVLFIDNLSNKVFKPFFDVSQQICLQLVLGPIHETFNKKTGLCKGPVTSKEKKMFGCVPLIGTAVTVLGFMKSDKIFKNLSDNIVNTSADSLLDDDNDGWDTDDDSETFVKEISKGLQKHISKPCQHVFTQTDKKDFNIQENIHTQTVSTGAALYSLVDRLSGLLNVLSRFKQQIAVKNDCDNCH